jgi:low temperature requirement protein LtrA
VSAAPPAASERRATWFELFCDLVFVAAVGEVTHRIGEHPTLGSVAGAAALFVPLWWVWVIYTVAANRFDPDSTAHRLQVVCGMFAVAGIAVFVGHVGHTEGADVGFVACYLAARAMIAVMYWHGGRVDPRLARVARTFALGSAISAPLWIAGLALASGPGRHTLWVLAVAWELAWPFLTNRTTAATSHDAGHLTERFGLFTIIVIGEVVLGLTRGLAGSARPEANTALTGAAAFAVCAGLWWTYFNASTMRPGSHTRIETVAYLRHVYVYGHLPAQLGLAVAGAAVGIAVGGSDRHMGTATAWCVVGGVAVYFASTALIRAAFTGFGERAVVYRLAAAVVLPALTPLAPVLPVGGLLAVLAAVIAATVLAEAPAHRRRAAGRATGGGAAAETTAKVE